jgi:hypothetical protein
VERISLLATVEREGHLSGKATIRSSGLPQRSTPMAFLDPAPFSVPIRSSAPDLCRDGYAPGRNQLNLRALVAQKNILRHPQSIFRTVVRTVENLLQAFAEQWHNRSRGLLLVTRLA